MTVGGKTSGRATIAPMGPRNRERVCANHRAMGVPTSNKMRVVSDASCRVSQMAAKSALVSGIYRW